MLKSRLLKRTCNFLFDRDQFRVVKVALFFDRLDLLQKRFVLKKLLREFVFEHLDEVLQFFFPHLVDLELLLSLRLDQTHADSVEFARSVVFGHWDL